MENSMNYASIKVGTLVEVQLELRSNLYGVVVSIADYDQAYFLESGAGHFFMQVLCNTETGWQTLNIRHDQVVYVVNDYDINIMANAIKLAKAKNYRNEHTGETLREMFDRINLEFEQAGSNCFTYNEWLDWLVISNKLDAFTASVHYEKYFQSERT